MECADLLALLASPDVNLSPDARLIVAHVAWTSGGEWVEVSAATLGRLLQARDPRVIRRAVAEAQDAGWIEYEWRTGRDHPPRFRYAKHAHSNADRCAENALLKTDSHAKNAHSNGDLGGDYRGGSSSESVTTNKKKQIHGSSRRQKRAPRPPADYPPEFEEAWAEYPKRAGSNSKAAAFRAWEARRKEGTEVAALLSGVRRYAAYIRGTGQERTIYVKQGVTFFGTDRHFEDEFPLPALGPARASPNGAKNGADSGYYEDPMGFQYREN